jgi:hypothetical protein
MAQVGGTPGNMFWGSPAVAGTATQSVSIMMTGVVSPLGNTDSVWILLYSDGSSGGGSSF